MNKPNYNEIIKTARKSKGLTQQELADEAGVSLRTIQRIERGTEEISGFSLRQICNVLEIPLEEIIMQNVNQVSIDTNQTGSIRNLYLTSLSFILFPLLGFLIPGLIGITKRNKNEYYIKHFRFILLLHGIQSILILTIVPIAIFFILSWTQPQEIQIINIDGYGKDIISDDLSDDNSFYNNLTYIIFFPIAYYLTNIYVIFYRIYHLEDLNHK